MSDINFKIIEKTEPDYPTNNVIKDYMNVDIPIKEIREKYNISPTAWRTLLKHFKEDGIPLRSNHNKNKKPKYYYFNILNKRWYVKRYFHSKSHNFGSYRTEEEAQARVQELEACDWEGLLIK